MQAFLSFLASIFSDLLKGLLTEGFGESTHVSSPSNKTEMPRSSVEDVLNRFDSLINNKQRS